jgi:transposase-like protein
MYIRFSLSLRKVEGLLYKRETDVCHDGIVLWIDRFGMLFAALSYSVDVGVIEVFENTE